MASKHETAKLKIACNDKEIYKKRYFSPARRHSILGINEQEMIKENEACGLRKQIRFVNVTVELRAKASYN